MKAILRAILGLLLLGFVAACTSPAVSITNRALDSRDTVAYNDYLRTMAEINLEREKAGLPPSTVMGRSEWAGKK